MYAHDHHLHMYSQESSPIVLKRMYVQQQDRKRVSSCSSLTLNSLFTGFRLSMCNE